MGEYPDVISYPLSIAGECVKTGARIIRADNENGNLLKASARYAAFFEPLSEDEGNHVFASLKPSREEARAVGRFLKYRTTNNFDEYSILKLMGKTADSFPEELINYELACGRMSCDEARESCELCRRMISENRPRRVADLAINGGDLMKLGLSGRAIGETLDRLLDEVVRGDVENEKEKLTEKVMRK